jgi:hypothetical protein
MNLGLRIGSRIRSKIRQVAFFLPMGLPQDAVDVVDVDGLVAGPDRFDQTADAEVSCFAEDTIGRADDEVDGGAGQGVVSQAVPVRILIAFVAKLTLYGFWLANRRFAELL